MPQYHYFGEGCKIVEHGGRMGQLRRSVGVADLTRGELSNGDDTAKRPRVGTRRLETEPKVVTPHAIKASGAESLA